MKHVKMIGLAAMAAMALMALVGAGTASAATSTICSAAESPCSATNKWPLGTVLHFTQKAGTSAALVNTPGTETLDTCTGSTVKGSLETDSTKGTLAGGKVTELTWETASTPCTHPTRTTVLGGLQVAGKTGSPGNGIVTATGEFKVEIVGIFGVTCFYGVNAGAELGEWIEGKPAIFKANAVAERKSPSSFLCPETARWTAEYTLTEPSNTTGYISAS